MMWLVKKYGTLSATYSVIMFFYILFSCTELYLVDLDKSMSAY